MFIIPDEKNCKYLLKDLWDRLVVGSMPEKIQKMALASAAEDAPHHLVVVGSTLNRCRSKCGADVRYSSSAPTPMKLSRGITARPVVLVVLPESMAISQCNLKWRCSRRKGVRGNVADDLPL
jgi:hypothetical protein